MSALGSTVFTDFEFCIGYLFKLRKLFYIRHIAWCIFIHFVNKSCSSLLLELNSSNWRRIEANLKVKLKCALCFYKLFKTEGKRETEGKLYYVPCQWLPWYNTIVPSVKTAEGLSWPDSLFQTRLMWGCLHH